MIKKTIKLLSLSLTSILLMTSLYIALAPFPKYRAERIFFGYLLPVLQVLTGHSQHNIDNKYYGFVFEDPKTLQPIRDEFHLDEVVKPGKTDLEKYILLMHWVRDQFPHGIPDHSPNSQSFDTRIVLNNKDPKGYLCGTASQILVQAITSFAGYARRVELRFTPVDRHAVIEVWSEEYNKWVLLDADYDIYYTENELPLNAIELHTHWANNQFNNIKVHDRESPHNIYQKEVTGIDSSLIRSVYEKKEWDKWDKKISKEDPFYFENARFAVKLLNYYSQISYPLRTDWISRPGKWWYPYANHVQNSLVILLPSMRNDEDFLVTTDSPENFYQSPQKK